MGKRDKDNSKVLGLGFQAELHKAKDKGLGQAGDDAIVALFKAATGCPIYAMQTIAKTKWEVDGPITPGNLTESFGAEIDILAGGNSPAGVSTVTSTEGLINGEFQTPFLACAIGMHLEPPQFCFTAQGNSMLKPTTGTTRPLSPDSFVFGDVPSTPLPSGMRPAVLEYGWWANKAMWWMVRAYALRWTHGSLLNIMDEELRDTAYMPPNSQDGTGSSSEVDLIKIVNDMNAYYTGTLGSTDIFLWEDAVRQGLLAAGTSAFSVARDMELNGVTYGGGDLRSKLKCNDEFRTLTNPYLLRAGVPIGLKLEERDEDAGNNFRSWLSASNAGGLIPAVYTDAANINTGTGAAYTERTLDGGNASVANFAERKVYKFGGFFMSMEIKGWEVTELLSDYIKGRPDLAARICAECSTRYFWEG